MPHRAPLRESQCRTGDDVRKISSVRIASLKPSPSAPSRLAAGMRQPVNAKVASGWGAITSMRFAIENPGVLASTTKAADAACGNRAVRAKLCRARAREHAIEIRDPPVGDPRFLAIQHVAVAVSPGTTLDRSDIRPGVRLRQRNAAIASPAATRGRYLCLISGEPRE